MFACSSIAFVGLEKLSCVLKAETATINPHYMLASNLP